MDAKTQTSPSESLKLPLKGMVKASDWLLRANDLADLSKGRDLVHHILKTLAICDDLGSDSCEEGN